MFYTWLLAQHERQDIVGQFARHAISNNFPKHYNDLHLVLRHFERHERWRIVAKIAHREFRNAQRVRLTEDAQ